MTRIRQFMRVALLVSPLFAFALTGCGNSEQTTGTQMPPGDGAKTAEDNMKNFMDAQKQAKK